LITGDDATFALVAIGVSRMPKPISGHAQRIGMRKGLQLLRVHQACLPDGIVYRQASLSHVASMLRRAAKGSSGPDCAAKCRELSLKGLGGSDVSGVGALRKRGMT
jgi:hypothetical protein